MSLLVALGSEGAIAGADREMVYLPTLCSVCHCSWVKWSNQDFLLRYCSQDFRIIWIFELASDDLISYTLNGKFHVWIINLILLSDALHKALYLSSLFFPRKTIKPRVANDVKYYMLNTESFICLLNSAYYLMSPINFKWFLSCYLVCTYAHLSCGFLSISGSDLNLTRSSD